MITKRNYWRNATRLIALIKVPASHPQDLTVSNRAREVRRCTWIRGFGGLKFAKIKKLEKIERFERIREDVEDSRELEVRRLELPEVISRWEFSWRRKTIVTTNISCLRRSRSRLIQDAERDELFFLYTTPVVYRYVGHPDHTGILWTRIAASRRVYWDIIPWNRDVRGVSYRLEGYRPVFPL